MTTKPKGAMIKGIDMPKNCYSCSCLQISFYVDVYKENDKTEFFCKITSKRAIKRKRPLWCPLQEVK